MFPPSTVLESQQSSTLESTPIAFGVKSSDQKVPMSNMQLDYESHHFHNMAPHYIPSATNMSPATDIPTTPHTPSPPWSASVFYDSGQVLVNNGTSEQTMSDMFVEDQGNTCSENVQQHVHGPSAHANSTRPILESTSSVDGLGELQLEQCPTSGEVIMNNLIEAASQSFLSHGVSIEPHNSHNLSDTSCNLFISAGFRALTCSPKLTTSNILSSQQLPSSPLTLLQPTVFPHILFPTPTKLTSANSSPINATQSYFQHTLPTESPMIPCVKSTTMVTPNQAEMFSTPVHDGPSVPSAMTVAPIPGTFQWQEHSGESDFSHTLGLMLRYQAFQGLQAIENPQGFLHRNVGMPLPGVVQDTYLNQGGVHLAGSSDPSMTLPATFASITNPTTSTSLLNQSLYSFEGTVAMSDVNQSIATSNDPQDIRIENSDEYVDIDIILKSSSSNQSAPPATDYFPSTPSVSCDEGDSTKPRHRTSSSVDDRKCNQDRLNATCRNPPSHVLEHTRAKIESDACLQFGKLKPTVLEDGSIKCAFLGCPRTFENTGLLRSHMVVHVDGKPYSCEMCHGLKRYKRNHDLLRHQREVHFENDEAHVNDRDGEEDMVGYFATSAGSSLSALTAPRRSHPYSRAHYSQLEEEAEQTPADRKISSHNQKYRRKQLRTRVEQRVIWNGRQMENIDVELVRSRGRPRVRPLKRTEATVNEFSLIPPGPRPFSCEDARIVNLGRDDYHSSAAAVVTAATGGLLSTTRTAYSSTSASLGLVSSQSADSAQRLQDWLRIEANSTARWGSHSAQLMPQVASRPPSFQHLQGYYSPHHSQDNIHLAMAAAANAAAAPSLQSPLTVNGNEREQHQSNRDRIRREDEELIRLGRWRQINARVAERHRQRT